MRSFGQGPSPDWTAVTSDGFRPQPAQLPTPQVIYTRGSCAGCEPMPARSRIGQSLRAVLNPTCIRVVVDRRSCPKTLEAAEQGQQERHKRDLGPAPLHELRSLSIGNLEGALTEDTAEIQAATLDSVSEGGFE